MIRYLLIAKYLTCYAASLIFSSICFYLSLQFAFNGKIFPSIAASFMTYVFYTAAEACEIMLEILFSAK